MSDASILEPMKGRSQEGRRPIEIDYTNVRELKVVR
jgi:hypothetical protein